MVRRAGRATRLVVSAALGVAVAVVAAGAGASGLRAQEAPGLEEGRTVRITSPALVHHTLEGTLVERSATSLLVRPNGGDAPLELDLDAVRRLQVATGRHRATARGAFAGFWSGLILALIIYEVDEADDEIDPECGDLQCYEPWFFWAMAGGGAAVGAGVGSLFHVTEWADVPVGGGRADLSAGLAPAVRSGWAGVRPSSLPALELRLRVGF